VAHLAWQSGPPDEASDEAAADTPEEDAEVVDLTKQRLLGWLKGMFGGQKRPPGGEG
jgi:hypothetical protein